MSDCSTNAFKAKTQKTCGNCGHSLIGDCVADEYRTAHLNSVTDCGDWFSLEQRYEQLEQVAKEMCLWFDSFLKDWGEDFELGPDPKADIMHDRKLYRKKLEALGVILDD